MIKLNQSQNNYWCTYLMIDPVSGFAPMQWSDLGPVLICRKDRMPITKAHLEFLFLTLFHLLGAMMMKIFTKL